MKITILTVGKIKENYFSLAISEYVKRLGKYCRLQIVEVPDERTPDTQNEAEELIVKKREGERLWKYIREDSHVVVLAIEGQQLSSVEFSDKLSRLMVDGKSDITFVIGGSLGLDAGIIRRADILLSFSKMTFPHQLMRVVLLEQLYRAYRIMNNEPYHK